MTDEILFKENQKFSQWWIWIILAGSIGLVGYGLIQQVIFGEPFGDHPGRNTELEIVFGVTLLIAVLFISLRLDTLITRDGVYVKFSPFYLKFRHYSWDQIHSLYVRQYSPVGEYGGWGLRGFGSNRALNVSGNTGLQLELKNGDRLLIGTRKAEELAEVIKQVIQSKPPLLSIRLNPLRKSERQLSHSQRRLQAYRFRD